MKSKLLLIAVALSGVLLTSCAELIILGAGAAAGGYLGYKAGQEGYKVDVEPPIKIKKQPKEEDF
jgi:hypothetical protein